MPMFRCYIRGENFPGVITGADAPIGFYTTRYVEAASADDAELAALDLLRDDETLHVAEDARTEAEVFFEEIVEVAAGEELPPNRGFSFFPMEE